MKPVFLLDSQARPHPDLRCVRATTDNLQFEVHRAGQERHGTLDRAARTVFRVEFIDAAGIHVLENAAGEARGAGGKLVLRSPSRAVRRMLRVLDLDRALPVEQ